MIMQWSLLVTPLVFIHSVYVSGANRDCLAPPPCTCKGNTIDCYNRDLYAVPKFTVSIRAYDSLKLNLSQNYIIYITGNPFYNLTTTNASEIQIDISNMNLLGIDSDKCFHGLEQSLTGLWMQDNSVLHMPDALIGMSNLRVFNMLNNPINDFDNGAFETFGDSLEYLSFGGKFPYPWPTDLQYLTQLKSLHFNGYTGSLIPDDSFHSFRDTLQWLTIETTGLFSIPNAICHLSNLDFFVFTDNHATTAQTLMPSCSTPVITLITLELSNNDFDSFPEVFGTFPNILSLKVTDNYRLTEIDESTFSKIRLNDMDLSRNSFTRIPNALGQLTNLPNLYMRQNQITSLDKDQFPQTNLLSLDLSYNPIAHVTGDAFDHVSKLVFLIMDSVSLTRFPKALKALNNVIWLSLLNNQIVCNCGMSWILLEWPYHKNVTIYGNCSNIPMTFENYITQKLPNCP